MRKNLQIQNLILHFFCWSQPKFFGFFCQSDEQPSFKYRPKKLGQKSSEQKKKSTKKSDHSDNETNFIIEQIENLKREGNEYFGKKKFVLACETYGKALTI